MVRLRIWRPLCSLRLHFSSQSFLSAKRRDLQIGGIRATMSSSPPEIEPKYCLDPMLLNKVDTEQSVFLTKYPEYDGREILIAIIDTGVDPSLSGMQVTTTGERKLVDVIDCTGAGDVDTSTVRSLKDGTIEGLTGRTLQIPADWKCPTGKYHVGVKYLNELYTKGVKQTLSNEKKEDIFTPLHNNAMADALKALSEHEKQVGGSSDKTTDKWARDDLASRIDFLKNTIDANDVGVVADVIAWHDGDTWRACIDTSFRGRLSMCATLSSFKENGEYAFLTEKDSVAYTVRISLDGNLVEIAVPSGAHGSHVANIAAAHYPDNREKDGLAPGSKVISLNIGDHRLGSMETGQAMTRAFNVCAEMNVDVINMSFGEGTHIPDQGRIIEEARRLVDRRGVIFVSSAGNAGPALSSVGAPGGTTTGVIGIGAYLTAESADTLYGVFKPVESNIYPWSSRGPCPDGKLGVSLCAPAAAWAEVPKYCRQSKQMMNGTSMSSPNAAGSIACVLSGLRQNHLEWSPYMVRMALENTAQPLANSDNFSMGQGMIKISQAYDRLSDMLQRKVLPLKLTHFKVEASHVMWRSKGIYIREPNLQQPQEFNVFVEPVFCKHMSNGNTDEIAFEKQCIMQCSAPWVSFPKTFFAISQERNMVVTIDVSKAPKGASYTEIVALDSSDISVGPLYRIPITIIVPERVEDVSKGYISKLVGQSGIPERRFIAIPDYVTSAEISLKSSNKDELDRFTLHTVYLQDDMCSRNTETMKLTAPMGSEWKKCIAVKGGKTLEICVVRSWTRGNSPVDVELRVDLHGIEKPDSINIVHGSVCTPVRIRASPIRSFEINPAISFSGLVIPIKTQSAKIEPLGPRDVFITSGMQIHRALLTYKLNVTKTCEVRLELIGLTPYLYESPVDCVLFQIFSANKAYSSASGVYPDRYTHKLEKGEYTIQAQIRHPEEQVLEKFRDTPLFVHSKMPSKIALDMKSSVEKAILEKETKWTAKGMLPGQEVSLYAGRIDEEKLPKNIAVTSGSFLTGHLTVFKNSDLDVDKSKVVYYLSEMSTRATKGLSMVTTKKEKDQNEEMRDAIRDLEVSWISKLTDEKAAQEFYEACRLKYPGHLPLLQSRVKQIVQKKMLDQTTESVTEAIRLCGEILAATKPAEVLQFLAVKQEHADDLLTVDKWIALTDGDESTRKEAAQTVAKFDERKNATVFALQVLASFEQDVKLRKSKENIPNNIRFGALSPLIFGAKSEVIPISKKTQLLNDLQEKAKIIDSAIEIALKEIDTAWTGNQFFVKLSVWIALDDMKAALISAKHAASLGQFGRCAKLLNKVSEDQRASSTDSRVVDSSLAEVCDELGWVHLSAHFRNVMLVKNRSVFRPF